MKIQLPMLIVFNIMGPGVVIIIVMLYQCNFSITLPFKQL